MRRVENTSVFVVSRNNIRVISTTTTRDLLGSTRISQISRRVGAKSQNNMIPNMVEADINEEKKDDIGAEALPQSASKRRARAAGSAGLSELSKQLRIFQAKNEAQAVEINRLERQLRILADLQGINVADLRKALEDACADEAFGEMQSRVAKLKAELEAATLAKQGELRKDMAAPEIANLQLRVGELEEVEEKHEREIHHLYEQLRHERAKATRLESECDQYRNDVSDYAERLKNESAKAAQLEADFEAKLRKLQEEYARKMQEGLAANQQNEGKVSSVPPEMAADYERLLKSMKEKDEALRQARSALQAEQERTRMMIKDLDNQTRQSHVNSQVDNQNMMLLIKQLQEADSQNELRLAQYRTRFAVQDERIKDMGQQLESLYVAFGLLKEEQDSQHVTHAAVRSSLDEADAAMARQMENKQKKVLEKVMAKRNSPGRPPANLRVSTTPDSHRSYGTAETEPLTPTARAVGSPIVPSYQGRTSDPKTPTTWQLLFPKDQAASMDTYYSEVPDPNGLLISGMLIVKSKSMVRKWKAKSSKLYLSGDHYRWDLGEGKSFALQFGIAKVEYYPNHPLSFVVYTNACDSRYPVIRAAASCEEDYHRWMSALTKATSGAEYHPIEDPPRRSFEGSLSSPSVAATPVVPNSREESDLELALELSRQVT
eukprot:scaffold2077_cov119-Cylindrotheca_fusiformis.AAC.11